MTPDNGLAVFNNPLILGKLFPNFGKTDLLNLRCVSKLFDDECVRLFTKRDYGRWLDVNNYLEKNVQKLLEDSRHPELLIGKIEMRDTDKDLDSHSEFIKILTCNSEHITSLQFHCYPYEDIIPILNICSNFVELRFVFSIHEQPDDPELLSNLSFKFKNLSRLELHVEGKNPFPEFRKEISVDVFIKNVIIASDKLTMLSIDADLLALKFQEVFELSKKLMSLKTLHVRDKLHPDIKGTERRRRVEKYYEKFMNLLLLVKNSIENLHISTIGWYLISNEFEWPEMPKLNTISWSENLGALKVSHMPSKNNAPKLKLLLLGGNTEILDSMCYWRQSVMNTWIRRFELDKKIKSFWTETQSKNIITLFTDLKVELLFLNTVNDIRDGGFLLECIYNIPSLTRLIVRGSDESRNNVELIDISLKK